jgi:hypothetical protein
MMSIIAKAIATSVMHKSLRLRIDYSVKMKENLLV